MKIAIVTGASSGLGRSFIRELDKQGGLDEIWGVARRRERMEELAGELATPMRPLALDLTKVESVETLRALLKAVSYTHLDVYKRQHPDSPTVRRPAAKAIANHLRIKTPPFKFCPTYYNRRI